MFSNLPKNSTRPVFILGSGRSGTQAIQKILSDIPHIEAHHEYLFTNLLKYTVLYAMHKLSERDMIEKLQETHESAVYYCDKEFFVDSSNILSFLVKPLEKIFPDAVYIHLVRDGRNVVSSFFHKLGKEMYPPEAIAVLQQWLQSPDDFPSPPPEKKYWRELPEFVSSNDSDLYNTVVSYGEREKEQFSRICYHWKATNMVAYYDLQSIPSERKYFFKLENLSENPEEFERFLGIFHIPFTEGLFHLFQRPHNVVFPKQIALTDEQDKIFRSVCASTMLRLGYSLDSEAPHVDY